MRKITVLNRQTRRTYIGKPFVRKTEVVYSCPGGYVCNSARVGNAPPLPRRNVYVSEKRLQFQLNILPHL